MKASEEAPGGSGALSSERVLLNRYYLIARYGKKGLEFPSIFLSSGEEVLTAFSSIRAGQEFLVHADLGEGWCVREFSCGELVSMICALCAGIKRVLLDPLPGSLSAEAPVSLMWRDSFMNALIRIGHEKGGAPQGPARKRSSGQPLVGARL